MDKLQGMERILINGEWYVKETKEDIDVDFMFSNSCTVETDNYYFEATRCIKNDNERYYPDISIDVTIKEGIRMDWTKEYWDNTAFLLGILDGDKYYIELFTDVVTDKYDQQVFLKMLNKLKEIEWL
jgi:hypothetical protein